MASKRRLSKTILNPNSLCANEEVAIRNRVFFLFNEFNKCVAFLRDGLTETQQHFRILIESRHFKALTLSILQPNPYPWPTGVNININKSH